MTFLHPVDPDTPTPYDFTAVSLLLLNARSEVLLQLRDNKPMIFSPNQWGLWGGRIEPGETPRQAMHREVGEELRVRGKPFALRGETFLGLYWLPREHTLYGQDVPIHLFLARTELALDDFTIMEGQRAAYCSPTDALALPITIDARPAMMWLQAYLRASS